MSASAITASTAMAATSIASRLKLNLSAASAADAAFWRNMKNSCHAAVSVVTNMNAMGTSVTHAYFTFLYLMITVVPTPRAIAARSWFETPNMGQMVDM